MSGRQRIDGAPAFLLHAHPYSETSLIIDVFSREHGRLPILARGARRPRSAIRGILMAFVPLELDWFGAGEVKTLARAEWMGGMPLLKGRCLMLGYYLNELLACLLPREDAHPKLYDAYAGAIGMLAQGVDDAPELRRFELELLRELGYGVQLDVDAASGAALDPALDYVFVFERGPVPAGGPESGARLHGKTLCDMAADDYTDPRTRFESKVLMRQLIAHYLGGRPLQSRRIFMDLQEM